jgi:hypothetical protein
MGPSREQKQDDKFFKPIGEHAIDTDRLPDEPTADDDAVVDEIESLCLECHQNVSHMS